MPDPTDKHVGSRLRMRRMMMDMSQTDLGEAVGITFQQIQKYEKGANRISASRLQQFSNVLDVPVPFFFEGLPDAEKGQDGMAADVVALFSTQDGVRLARSFLKIKNRNIRRQIVELIGAIETDA